MVLNNQSAVLKRVENKVFFTVDSETLVSATGPGAQSFDTTIHTLPVGIVMTITPYIADNDEIILLVRPSVSSETGVTKTVPLPPDVPPIAGNSIPETVSQEMESILRLTNRQIGVLGGLMQDESRRGDNTIPGFARLPIIGKAFQDTTRQYFNSELVIFLRPIIIRNPSLDGDLNIYKSFLKKQTEPSPEGHGAIYQ
jgi:MSHA biogenesis protein MshL